MYIYPDLPTSEIPKSWGLENEQEKTLRFGSQTLRFTQKLQNEVNTTLAAVLAMFKLFIIAYCGWLFRVCEYS